MIFIFQQPYNNRSFNKGGSGTVDISDYYHPSMVQDPWKHFQLNSSETVDKNEISSNSKTEEKDEPTSQPQ